MENEEQQDLYDYISSRGIEKELIERMRSDKIDKEVILMMKDEELAEYIPLVGDRIATCNFCEGKKKPKFKKKNMILNRLRNKLRIVRQNPSSEEESDLESTSKSARLKGNRNAQRFERRIDIGWLHECEASGKYKQVRIHNGGGTRHLKVDKSTTPGQLLEIAKNLFFKDGVSSKGESRYFDFDICDFRHQKLEDDTTVCKLYDASKMSVLRFYLKTSKKLVNGTSEDEVHVDSGNDMKNDESDSDLPLVDVGVAMLQSHPSSHIDDNTLQSSSSVQAEDEIFPFDIDNNILPPSSSVQADDDIFPYDIIQPDTPTISFRAVDSDANKDKVDSIILIRRTLIIQDMINAFHNDDIMNHHIIVRMILPNGDLETGTGSGVYKDAITQFWETFFQSMTVGDQLKVPVLRHDYGEEEWRAVGRIITKGWLDFGFIPISLAPPFLGVAIYGSITNVDSKECFLRFVPQAERQVIEDALKDFPDDNEELTDILGGYDCRRIVSKENIERIICELGHKELIQQPMFVADAMREALAPLRENLPEKDFYGLYDKLQPNVRKVISMLNFPNDMTACQQAVSTYLKRYIRLLDDRMLKKFLRFCTGTDIICDSIFVEFNTLEGFQRRPIGHTCGNVLEIPSTYESFVELKKEIHEVLESNVWVMDII